MDFLSRKFNNIHLFICGAQLEYEDVSKNYGYESGAVAYTGLARFDNYKNLNIKRQILVMPTWRRGADDKDIRESNYFKCWTSFINNIELSKLLNKNGVKLYFYLHPIFQKYVNYFESHSEDITIANSNNFDVQKLLKESALLITDYSSVLFDFAFMKKPSLYYQFDRSSYYGTHYKKGYFSYDKDSFGYVCRSEEELVEKINDCIKTNFEFPICFVPNFEKFFVKHDNLNCARIFECILHL